jgi:hypothetical protein
MRLNALLIGLDFAFLAAVVARSTCSASSASGTAVSRLQLAQTGARSSFS